MRNLRVLSQTLCCSVGQKLSIKPLTQSWSMAVPCSDKFWGSFKMQERKVGALYLLHIVHTSRYLEAKQKLQRETTSAGLFVVPPLQDKGDDNKHFQF